MRKNTGSMLMVVVICLTLALITALGWIAWQNFVYKQPVVTSDVPVVSRKSPEVSQKSTSDTSSMNWATLDDWAVKFDTSVIKNTSLVYEKRQIGEADFYAFTTRRVIALGGDCAKGYPFGDIVTLQRSELTTTGGGLHPGQVKVGNYLYSIRQIQETGLEPASKCIDNSLTAQDQAAIVSSLETLIAK